MMRRTEGSRSHEHVAAPQLTGHRMDFGGFKRLAHTQRREDGRNALGHHRFAGTGRADHYQVVAAGAGHFQRPFYGLLAFDFGEVVIEMIGSAGEDGARVDHGGTDFGSAEQDFDDLPEGTGA